MIPFCQEAEVSFFPFKWIRDVLRQWFSKCGPRASTISITWELIKSVNYLTPPQTYLIRVSRGIPVIHVLTIPLMPAEVWKILFQENQKLGSLWYQFSEFSSFKDFQNNIPTYNEVQKWLCWANLKAPWCQGKPRFLLFFLLFHP